MGAIGAPELIVLVLSLCMVAIPIVIVVRLLRRKPNDLVPCRACGRQVSPRAETCPRCGEPRVALRG